MAQNQMFEVLRPVSGEERKVVNIAPRLGDLKGKTIGELSSNIYNAHISFPIIRDMLKERFPDIKIIPYTEINERLPQSTIVTYSGDIETQEAKERAIVKIAMEKGVDGFIIGNGG
jgi:hypothetical protein